MKRWWMQLLRYAAPHRGSIGGLILLSCGTVLLELLKPWPMKLILDSAIPGRPLPPQVEWLRSLPGGGSASGLILLLALGTLALFIAAWAAKAWQSYVQAGVGSRMVYDLGLDVFHHLQRLSLQFHGKRPAGDLVQRVTSDTQCVRELAMNVMLPLFSSLLSLTMIVGVLAQFDRGLAVVAVLAAPLIVLVIRMFDKPMTDRSYRELQIRGDQMAHAEQTLNALPAVQAFCREPMENARFSDLANQAGVAYVRAVLAQSQFKVATASVTALGTAAVMAYGGLRVAQGSLTLGGLVLCLSYLASIYAPMETLAYLHASFASAAAGARRVLEILRTDNAMRDAAGAQSLSQRLRGEICWENVTFGYEREHPVLRDVSFSVQPGETIAVVGPTGAGKSTLLSLVLRFFDPWSGRVTVDGMDSRSLKITSLREQIAVVLQEPFLLPLTIAQNIAYGSELRMADVEAASTAAHAHEFIGDLPNGYDTVIGERGASLSGGQKQRLAIARALYRDAPILILDEPTSALDPETEQILVESWERLRAGRTTLIIAHRLSTIEAADRIIVLDQGRIVQAGAHAELLTVEGPYRRLYDAQFQTLP